MISAVREEIEEKCSSRRTRSFNIRHSGVTTPIERRDDTGNALLKCRHHIGNGTTTPHHDIMNDDRKEGGNNANNTVG